MKIVLKSDIFEITKVKRKTKANMLENLKAGDLIQLSVDASPVGSNRGSTYASYIKIEDLKTKECAYKSFNQIWGLYNTFELEQYTKGEA